MELEPCHSFAEMLAFYHTSICRFSFFLFINKQICICTNELGCLCYCLLFADNFPTICTRATTCCNFWNCIKWHGTNCSWSFVFLCYKTESTYITTILMSNIGNYIHCQTLALPFPVMLSLLVSNSNLFVWSRNIFPILLKNIRLVEINPLGTCYKSRLTFKFQQNENIWKNGKNLKTQKGQFMALFVMIFNRSTKT